MLVPILQSDQILSHHGDVHTIAMALHRCRHQLRQITEQQTRQRIRRSKRKVEAVTCIIVIPSVSRTRPNSVIRSPGSHLLPLGECRRNSVGTAYLRSKFALADTEAADGSTKLMNNYVTLPKHAEWRKTCRVTVNSADRHPKMNFSRALLSRP